MSQLLEPRDVHLVQSSFSLLEARLAELVALFYEKLFATHPEVRRMFPDDMAEQQKKLAATLKLAVASTSDLEKLLPALQSLGAKHAAYGVTAGHFDAVGAALLAALASAAGTAWSDELESAWAKTYGIIARTMIDAMERERAASGQMTLRSELLA